MQACVMISVITAQEYFVFLIDIPVQLLSPTNCISSCSLTSFNLVKMSIYFLGTQVHSY